jgi:carotenoid cleavage dioxygenase
MNQQQKIPFWLDGNFAPTFEEVTETHLEVVGEIPSDMNGLFLRNGPNPQSGNSDHWFLGDGMLHGVELRNGAANWYRNRYVQTPLYHSVDTDPMTTFGDKSSSLANTHVISHAGKILALEELHQPYEIGSDLSTIGAYDFNHKLKTGMTAHPKICGKTGEMLFFAYDVVPPYMTYHRVSADGQLIQSEEITVKGPTMVHDFNITENFVILMDLPVVFSLDGDGFPFKWDETYGARLGVMPRDGSDKDVTWYEIDPCFVYHPVNAYDNGDQIVLDVCRQDSEMKSDAGVFAYLYRWTIDQTAGTVDEQRLDDIATEFPRVPDHLVGQDYTYAYMVEFESVGAVGLRKYNMKDGTSVGNSRLPGQEPGEPVFIQKENAVNEDDGYVVTFVYDENTNRSEFVILDAAQFDAPPLARVLLPTRVPAGFHGSWIND